MMEVLCTKHLEPWTPTTASLDYYKGQPPELTPVDITKDTVTAVAGRLSGGAGPGGTDSVSLQHWLLRFSAASAELRLIFGDFVQWLGNGQPSWAVYQGVLPPETSALLPLFRLGGRAARGGGDGYPEKGSQSPGHQVEAALLKDVWIRHK